MGVYRVAVSLSPWTPWRGRKRPRFGRSTPRAGRCRMRWVRQTLRHDDSPVALEARWRAIGEERLSIIGLTDRTPKRQVDQAWVGLPLLREYQGLGRAEQAFRERVRIALRKLGERPSSFVRGLTITRIARAGLQPDVLQ